MSFFSKLSESFKGFAASTRSVAGDLLDGTTKGNSIGSLVGVVIGVGVGVATGGLLPAIAMGIGLGAACGIAGGAIAGGISGAMKHHHNMAQTVTPPVSEATAPENVAPQQFTGLESPQMPEQEAISFRERLSQEANSQSLSR